MAKKNMDILLGNILGKAAIHPQDRFDKSPGDSKEERNEVKSPLATFLLYLLKGTR